MDEEVVLNDEENDSKRMGMALETDGDFKILKIGLLNDGEFIDHYIKELIDWSKQQTTIQITHCIIHQENDLENPKKGMSTIMRHIRSFLNNGIMRSVTNLLFLLIRTLEHYYLLKKKSLYKNHLTHYRIHDFGLIPIHINPIVSKSKQVHRFSKADLEIIEGLNLDVLLRCGRPLLLGDILHVTQFGIISLHHGDNDCYRGVPDGFWEVYEKNNLTGFIIQKLQEELDDGAVFVKGLLNTKPYWLLNQAVLYTQANYYLKEFLKQLACHRKLPETLARRPYSQRLYKKPNLRECVHYLKQQVKSYYNHKCHKGRWHVSFVCRHWDEAVLWKGIDFPYTPGIGLADPFLYSKDGKDFCFLEEIDEQTEKGSIAAYELFQDHAVRLGTVLKEPFHLSYPYLFDYKGVLYMLPETSENHDIRLYECVDFPFNWKLKHILIQDIIAADSILIPTQEAWWLLTNLDHPNTKDHSYDLSIFSAESPLSSQWVPHPKNPVYIDASRSRNGGFFHLDNKYYRVSQCPSMDVYGESIYINEIKELNHHVFKEQRIAHLTPGFKKNLQGIHHFHTNGKITVFDYYELNAMLNFSRNKTGLSP